MSVVHIVTSESDFEATGGVVSSGTYIIQDEVMLTHNLTFASGCNLIFHGCLKALEATHRDDIQTEVILTGNNTLIDAPMMQIFNDNIVFAGTWRMDAAYPEWFGTHADAAISINKALQLLTTFGGPLRLTGPYTINSPIIVPPHIVLEGINPAGSKIILQEKEGVTHENYNMFEVDDDRWLTSREISRKVGQTTEKLVKTVRAAIYFQNYSDVSALNIGCGARNLRVFMNGCACHAFYVERPYDQTVWENIQVERVHHSFNAFRFTVCYELQNSLTESFDTFTTTDGQPVPQSTLDSWNDSEKGRCGQTVLMLNCWGLQNPYPEGNHFLTSPVPPSGKVIAPVYYLYHQQEINIIGCKAGANQSGSYRIGNRPRTVTEYGGTCFHLEGCRGVVMTGCSVGGCNIGIAVKSLHRSTDGVTINGLTSEGVAHLDILAQGTKYATQNSQGATVYNTLMPVRRLVVTPIRHEDSNGGIYLEECFMSHVNVVAVDQLVYLMSHCIMVNVATDGPTINVAPALDFNPAIQAITGTQGEVPLGTALQLYTNANLKRGARFHERITIVGHQDNNGGTPINTESVDLQMLNNVATLSLHGTNKMHVAASAVHLVNTSTFEVVNGTTSSQAMARVAPPTANSTTSLQLLVRRADGTNVLLPVKIGAADGSGRCQLYVQL